MASRRSFNAPRRIPPPAPSSQAGGGSTIYAQVPTSPGSSLAHQHTSRPYNPPYPPNRSTPSSIGDHGAMDPATTRGVAAGTIGSDYGPYAYSQEGGQTAYSPAATRSRFSHTEHSVASTEKPRTATATVPPFLWDSKDPDLDDPLHSYDPERDALADREWTIFSLRGWLNGLTLFILAFGIIVLFAGYPIYSALTKQGDKLPGFNLGGTNSTGQVPDLPNLPDLIDKDTPDDKRYRTGYDGSSYRLVFSDEFNTDGRTFYPGDDPFWEAVDFHYWPTADIEWYDPAQVTTRGGHLVLTMQQILNHRMNFRSGMLQSWNKFCFTSGYIEVSISLPGTSQTPGFWPGAWTMGNLGRPGYGATTDGTWPYSYDVCDLGTLANQTLSPGNPPAASTMGDPNYNNVLSFLPGQRLSACTCPGEDHPGPQGKGRGSPEIDILEAQIEIEDVRRGVASQSFQMAPFNAKYEFGTDPGDIEIYDPLDTKLNTYKGSIYQQAASALSYINSSTYNGESPAFGTYGFEYWPGRDKDSHITWDVDGKKTWSIYPSALKADPVAGIGPRTIAEEPMTIILNFGMSPGFQPQDFNVLPFPAEMLVDYVRVYQKEGWENIGCDPDGFPTTAYIASHPEAYGNWNWTTWQSAGYTFPKSSAKGDC